MKIYFDNVIVSATVRPDQSTGEMAAIEKLVAAFADGKIDVETSRLAWDEQDKAKGTIKAELLSARERFPIVPNDTKLLGASTIYYEGGFMSAPRLTGIMDEDLYKTFRAAGLEERDAQHLMYAVHDRCDRFVTTDGDFLKSRRPTLEASCRGLLIRRPSELGPELAARSAKPARTKTTAVGAGGAATARGRRWEAMQVRGVLLRGAAS